MFAATLTLAGLGLLFGGLLAFASKKLAVEIDPRIERVQHCLPGANCGACGYGGCSQFAEAVTRGEAPISACIPGGCEVSHEVAEILGVGIEDPAEMKVATLLCLGDLEKARENFDYDGVQDCKAAALFGGGPKACAFACLGLWTCVRLLPL
jgi:Na+-translocating ferredoxin:NAD+ oxidoreductase subunit B